MKNPFDLMQFSNSFAKLSDDFYSLVSPTPFSSPAKLIHFNSAAAKLLDLDIDSRHHQLLADVFSGKISLNGGKSLAMLYAGHQFGHYVPQLGDGRAILLGETTNNRGERWEIQLKGSGLTPYSRDGDGRAVLRSSIREYLCSEAMHGLGIPTTRALCLVGSDDEVYREQVETGAMLTRLAQSHVRFGSFEIFYYRDQHDQISLLADYVIEHHYREFADQDNPYLALLETVSKKTAELIAKWQAVGFSHGVMNSDNMSILGLTLDYGPFGFMEAYNPGYICNHSDHTGRYAFNNQPQIGLFNLSCLAQAFLPLIEVDDAKKVLAGYEAHFLAHYHALMATKLGFSATSEPVQALVNELLSLMQTDDADYTNVFRALCFAEKDNRNSQTKILDCFKNPAGIQAWLKQYWQIPATENRTEEQRRRDMLNTNPKYILRNYMAQIAIDKAKVGDYSEVDNLARILQQPFSEHSDRDHYTNPPPEWAETIQVSCSS